jgi:hypothetical protein
MRSRWPGRGVQATLSTEPTRPAQDSTLCVSLRRVTPATSAAYIRLIVGTQPAAGAERRPGTWTWAVSRPSDVA